MWTPDRDLLLRNLHALGQTPNQIASRMGVHVARTDVINRLHALGLHCSTPPIPDAPREKWKTPKTFESGAVSLVPIPRSRVLAVE